MKTKFYDLGVTGCSDGACIFQDNSKGMHTNGGCGCCRNQHKVLRALNTQDQQIESLRATISRLREYANHRSNCSFHLWDSDAMTFLPCDCGYDDLMEELEDGK